MSTPDSFDAFHDYLVAEWTSTPLLFENDGDDDLPDEPGDRVFVEVFGSFFAQESVGAPGNNLWRESGQTYLHVLTVRATGSRPGRVIANDLAKLFMEQGPDGVRILDMSIGAGEPGENDGNYYRMTLTVNWERDTYS